MLNDSPLNKEVLKPIWLTIAESSKICGVNKKTIRRAILARQVKYKIARNKYLVDCASLIRYSHTNKKLHNKLKNSGLGQYVAEWKK